MTDIRLAMTEIKLAIAPIGWSNDDMPELGGHISFEQCIEEMAAAGYQGCEVGHKFPRNPDILHTALSARQLSVASAWYSLYFTENSREEETRHGFLSHMNFLKAMNAKVIVVCECGHSIQGKPQSVIDNKPHFSSVQWQSLITGLHQIGKDARENDMSIVYHPHMGTGVQTQEEIDHLMHATDPELVSLLFDTGHIYFAGNSPLEVLQQHGHRIRHVHLKDIRMDILNQVKNEKLSFLQAVRAGVFTVPGDGCIEYMPILSELVRQQYKGWWVVEAEQDPDKAAPLVYAKMARKYLHDTMGI